MISAAMEYIHKTAVLYWRLHYILATAASYIARRICIPDPPPPMMGLYDPSIVLFCTWSIVVTLYQKHQEHLTLYQKPQVPLTRLGLWWFTLCSLHSGSCTSEEQCPYPPIGPSLQAPRTPRHCDGGQDTQEGPRSGELRGPGSAQKWPLQEEGHHCKYAVLDQGV